MLNVVREIPREKRTMKMAPNGIFSWRWNSDINTQMIRVATITSTTDIVSNRLKNNNKSYFKKFSQKVISECNSNFWLFFM